MEIANRPFSPARVDALDGLRGIAIVMVMVFHSGATSLDGGYLGVDLFFVLSGFLISALLVSEFDRHGRVRMGYFYLRRLLRLAPALLLMLLVFAAWVPLAFPHDHQPFHMWYQWEDCLIALAYLANWARALDIHSLDFLGHTWSLSIEEQFYLLWPWILLAMLRYRLPRGAVVVVALLLALAAWYVRLRLLESGASMMRLYNGLDTRADGLMIGSAAGIAVVSGLLSRQQRWLQCLLSVAAPLALVWIGWWMVNIVWTDPRLYRWLFFSVEVAAVVIVLALYFEASAWFNRMFTMRWLVWVGSISYGLYLWHYPIFRALMMADYDHPTVLWLGGAAALVAASLSYYGLESPCLRLKQRLHG